MHGKSEVIVISGFLGAGKTTLLKKILIWESDLSETVVIVNEFGDVRTVRISRAFMD